MKILIIIFGFLLSFGLSANELIITEQGDTQAEVRTVCLDGYLYAVVISRRGVGITQMYTHGTAYTVAPIRCK